MRLVQLINAKKQRKIAMVEEPNLKVITGYSSIYELAQQAITAQKGITQLVQEAGKEEDLNYDEVYEGKSGWGLLPAFDHPDDPNSCMVSGTGLTHKASAENRNKMHEKQEAAQLTDSMQMYLWGQEGGRPEAGHTGIQPEWFYKGNGSILKGHGEMLRVPSFGDDGGEEPELAAAYVNDSNGKPWRIGMMTANEFSDHVMEKKNYLYLAPSKIRDCSLGPELVINADFDDVKGRVRVVRKGEVLWEKEIHTGDKHMVHSLSNLEHHHFKYPSHRLPGQAHIHFLGADAFSFGEKIILQQGDMMEVSWEGMGRPLQNYLKIMEKSTHPVSVEELD